MKRLLSLAFVLAFLSLPAVSHGAFLKGQVVCVGKEDEYRPPDKAVSVTIKETGDSENTKAQGLFRIFIPDHFKAGEKITLLVDHEGYRIQYPLDGEVNLPADLTKSTVEIRLLPVGSKKFWSEDRIEKFIANTAEQSKAQVRPEGRPEDIDFTRAIKDWATHYGFSAAQAKAEINKWIAQVKEKEVDLHKLALAAFAEKKFSQAESLFTQSVDAKSKDLKALIESIKAAREREKKLTNEIISDCRLAGDAAYNNYNFQNAMTHYEKAVSYVSQETQPRLWAEFQIEIANASAQKGIRSESHKTHEYLKKSISAYRIALKVFTRDQLPQQWVTTQNNLGSALRNQGTRIGGEQGKTLIIEAVSAFNSSLKIRTYETLAPQWAQTKYNLGRAYCLLEDWQKAATCYIDCLKVFPSSHEIINQLSFIYHERLFEFEKSYEMDTILIKKLATTETFSCT